MGWGLCVSLKSWHVHSYPYGEIYDPMDCCMKPVSWRRDGQFRFRWWSWYEKSVLEKWHHMDLPYHFFLSGSDQDSVQLLIFISRCVSPREVIIICHHHGQFFSWCETPEKSAHGVALKYMYVIISVVRHRIISQCLNENKALAEYFDTRHAGHNV